jgi:ribosomal protein S18 acetylase RimI-like enzyme
LDNQGYPIGQRQELAGRELIRHATPQDIDVLVDIYIECFPERVSEVFGGSHRRTFIRDYLLFYLAWDPAGNWVYVRDGAVIGFIIVPCRYSPWRALLSRGQLLQWIGHFLGGDYGFPIHLVRKFFHGGFTFTADAAIKRLWGKPYIHLIAVKAADPQGNSRGLLGIGRRLLRWAITEHQKKGMRFCWGVVQPTGTRFIPIWKRTGFKIVPISNGEHLALWGDPDEDMCHSECR